jgi:sugar lactone lactonase YvrE
LINVVASPHFFLVFRHVRKAGVQASYLLVVIMAGLLCSTSHAQTATAHFSGSQFKMPFTSLNNPRQVAVDANGTLYIADSSNNRVLKETLSGGSYTQTTIGTGLNSPLGVAVDANGNVYIVDSGRLMKETLSGVSYTQSTISSNVGVAWSVAVDANGNVFVADPQGGRVLRETPSGNGYIESTIGTGLSLPDAVTVDGMGNVYVADRGINQVVKETLSDGSYTQSLVTSGLSYPSSVAVDGSGNVYIATYGTAESPQGSRVFKETLSNGSYTQSIVGSSPYYLVGPIYIAVDNNGRLFIDYYGGMLQERSSAADFGLANVATPSSPISLIFTFDTAGTINKPAVVTQGVSGLDFTDAGTGTCTTLGATFSYTQGASCTVDVIFKPISTGRRYGAAVLQSGSGTVIATGYVHGTGVGPQANFLPGTRSNLSLGNVVSPYAIAADAGGSLYITEAVSANSPQNAVVKETWTGNGYTQSTVATALAYPVGVAVDGAGNVYIADQNGTKVLKETPQIGGGYTLSAAFTNLGNVESVAVDGSGNVYIGSIAYGVLKETLIAGNYTQSTIARTVYSYGIAVDEQENVYLSDTPNNQILKETLSNGSYIQTTIATSISGSPHGIAIDGSGNLYIANPFNNQLVKETVSGSGYTQSTIATEMNNILGVVVDSSGNIFASSPVGNSVWKLDFADPPSLSFATTTAGSTSSAQTVTVNNIGNAPLSFPIPASGTNPSVPANFILNSTSSVACPLVGANSSTSGTLDAGSNCQLPISFAPTSGGTISGSLVLTDTSLNAAVPGYATQSIALSGTALDLPILSFAAIAAQTYGNPPFTVNATSASTGAVTYAVASGPATILGSTVTLTGTGTVVLNASQAANGNYGPATATTSFTVAPITPTLNFAAIAAQTYGNPPFTVNATSASSGAVTFIVASGPATISGSTVTLTGAGTVVLNVSQAANGNYGPTTATTSFTVAPITPTLNFAAIAAQTYGNPPFTVNATSASSGAVTFTVASGPATISGSTVTLTGAGTVVLNASQVARGNYGPATATTSFTVVAQTFTLTPSSSSGSGSATTIPGGTASYSLTLTPSAGTTFPNPVTLSATGLPTGAIATFSPATLPAGSGATPVALAIQTSSSQTAHDDNSPLTGTFAPVALGVLLLPTMGTKLTRKPLWKMSRLMAMLALVAVSVGGVMSLSGCSSNGSSSPVARNYTIVVTAKDVTTGAQTSTTLTLTVN